MQGTAQKLLLVPGLRENTAIFSVLRDVRYRRGASIPVNIGNGFLGSQIF